MDKEIIMNLKTKDVTTGIECLFSNKGKWRGEQEIHVRPREMLGRLGSVETKTVYYVSSHAWQFFSEHKAIESINFFQSVNEFYEF